MKLVILDSGDGEIQRNLKQHIAPLVSPERLRVVPDARELTPLLRDPDWRNAVLLLSALDEAQLDVLLEMRDELTDRRLILVLGEATLDVVAKAHRLYPRFIMQNGVRWGELAEVLARMGVFASKAFEGCEQKACRQDSAWAGRNSAP